MHKRNLHRVFLLICLSLSFSFLLSCDGTNLDELGSNGEPKSSSNNPGTNNTTPPDKSQPYDGKVVLNLTGEPEISLNEGLTSIIFQFIPRNEDNFPLSPDQVNVSFKIDDEDVDVESYLETTAEELVFNVNFGLVLDASYSMKVAHDSDAFPPMLEAAKRSVETGIEIWSKREDQFNFHTTWFNNYIYSSVNTINRQWNPNDITSIPDPESGSFTKLFAAIDYQIENLSNILANSETKGPRDQNIILVFSDGADNYSQYDNSSDSDGQQFSTDSGARYKRLGRKETTKNDVIARIGNEANLTIHVIALGEKDKIKATDLEEISNAGSGIFKHNPNTSEIDTLFEFAIQQFTTLQTHGVKMPILDGEYKFTILVENEVGNNFAEHSFNFKTGDEGASIITTE